jgi:hypothetical protein
VFRCFGLFLAQKGGDFVEEKSSIFSDLLSIGLGIFVGIILLDVVQISRQRREEEPEYIVTSRGRKLYVENETTDAVSNLRVAAQPPRNREPQSKSK